MFLWKNTQTEKPILTNLTADCGRAFSQIITHINRSDVNDEWQWPVSICTWELLSQWPFKFIFCLYRVFLIIFLFMWEIFVWQGSGKFPINFTRARNSPHMHKIFSSKWRDSSIHVTHCSHCCNIPLKLKKKKKKEEGGSHTPGFYLCHSF